MRSAGATFHELSPTKGEIRRANRQITAREYGGDFFQSIDQMEGYFAGDCKRTRRVLAANLTLADNPAAGLTQVITASSTDISSERSGSSKVSARKPTKKEPDRPGNFVHDIINNIRVQSEHLYTHYGSPSDWLDEAEVCLTMREAEDNQVRLCLNTTPRDDASTEGR
jgi:hypothetical protein